MQLKHSQKCQIFSAKSPETDRQNDQKPKFKGLSKIIKRKTLEHRSDQSGFPELWCGTGDDLARFALRSVKKKNLSTQIANS